MAINVDAILAAIEQAKQALDQIEMEAGSKIKDAPPPGEPEGDEAAPGPDTMKKAPPFAE